MAEQHAIPAADDAPPAFTPEQRKGIRRIARRYGYPYDQWWDFVHETWLDVHDGWRNVPRVEPATTHYILRIAHNLAKRLFKRFKDDAMTGAVMFSSLPEGADDEEEAAGEERPGTPEIARLTIEQRVLVGELWRRAVARDREAADWLVRHKVEEETVPDIAADVGKPAARIYKRLSRLVDALNPPPAKPRKARARRKRKRRRRHAPPRRTGLRSPQGARAADMRAS